MTRVHHAEKGREPPRQRERQVQQLCRNDQDIDKNSRRPMRRCSSIAGEVVRHSVVPEPSKERAW